MKSFEKITKSNKYSSKKVRKKVEKNPSLIFVRMSLNAGGGASSVAAQEPGEIIQTTQKTIYTGIYSIKKL